MKDVDRIILRVAWLILLVAGMALAGTLCANAGTIGIAFERPANAAGYIVTDAETGEILHDGPGTPLDAPCSPEGPQPDPSPAPMLAIDLDVPDCRETCIEIRSVDSTGTPSATATTHCGPPAPQITAVRPVPLATTGTFEVVGVNLDAVAGIDFAPPVADVSIVSSTCRVLRVSIDTTHDTTPTLVGLDLASDEPDPCGVTPSRWLTTVVVPFGSTAPPAEIRRTDVQSSSL